MTDPTVTCDHCGKGIVRTNCEDYMLRLVEISKPPAGGSVTVTLMHVGPELSHPHDFCDMRCLCRWASKQTSPWSGKSYAQTPIPEELP